MVITVDKKYQDKVGRFYLSTRINPEEHATILGKVISTPRGVIDRIDYKGFTTEGILPDDTVIMRYDVIHNYLLQPERDTPIYKFEMVYKGMSYWRADILKIFGYIRDGKITMINGFVMLEPIQDAGPKIYVPNHMRQLRTPARAIISHIGRPLSHLKSIPAKAGDLAIFDSRNAQQYQINGKPFIILKQKHIMGIEDEYEA